MHRSIYIYLWYVIEVQIYRLGFARTRPQARQFVTHGHALVDGQRVNIPSYIVQPGETVTMSESALEIPDVRDRLEERPRLPGWIEPMDGGGRWCAHPSVKRSTRISTSS